jgi:membrane fusion protein (multidrug efflux system)
MLVPEEAIWPVGQEKTVYVVVDGKAQQRTVSIGERLPGQVEILSGLEVGETIVTAGQMKLHDGADVQSKSASTSATN